MSWDDDLERLATFVREHFGTEVLQAAGRRALTSLTPIDVSDGKVVEDDDVIEGADGQLYAVEEFWEAVRRELQRLVAPH